jgi:hypothetical protein
MTHYNESSFADSTPASSNIKMVTVAETPDRRAEGSFFLPQQDENALCNRNINNKLF